MVSAIVKKFRFKKNLIVLQRLFLEGDEIYIQNPDPVNGVPQQVFLADRTHIGNIDSSFYYLLVNNLDEI